jgi:hypothetical protein
VTELPDYYAILGVPATASYDEIRAAYRRLALHHHPDVNPPGKDDAVANEFMRQLNKAYEVLNTPRRRAAYDRQRWARASSPQQEAPYRPGRAWSPAPDDAGRGPQTGGGRWRPSKARRQVYDQPMPGWLESYLAVAEHLKMRLEPFSTLIGVIGPVLVLAVLLILGFWAYEEVQADPKAMGFLNCIIGAAGGIWVLFGVLGVMFLFFLIVWLAMWRAFKG